jgi:hypothetical protein
MERPMFNRRSSQSQVQQGIALLSALFALLLISALAIGMMYMANTETSINYNYRDMQKAQYAAYAGIQEVRARLMPTSASNIPAPTVLPSATGGIIYLLNPAGGSDTVDPKSTSNPYFDTELCHEFASALSITDTGANVPCASGAPTASVTSTPASVLPDANTSAQIPFKWVRITLKNNKSAGGDATHPWYVTGSSATATTTPICWDGSNQLLMPADGRATCDAPPVGGTANFTRSVYMITSLAVTPTGARKMLQVEAAFDPPFVSNAAIDTNDFVNTTGSSLTINGYDNCNCICTLAPGSAVPHCADRITGANCTGNTYAIFTSQEVDSTGSPAIIAGTTPAVAEHQPFPYDVPSLINKYKTAPGAVNTTSAPYNMVCTGTPSNCGNYSGSGSTFGTPPAPFPPTDVVSPPGEVDQITYIPGSVDLQAHTGGAGVLVIDGDLTIHGGIDFYGLIIVKGVITFSGSGSGQGVNVIGGIVSGNGSVADTIGGGVNIQFDHCALGHDSITAPPKLLSARELSY